MEQIPEDIQQRVQEKIVHDATTDWMPCSTYDAVEACIEGYCQGALDERQKQEQEMEALLEWIGYNCTQTKPWAADNGKELVEYRQLVYNKECITVKEAIQLWKASKK